MAHKTLVALQRSGQWGTDNRSKKDTPVQKQMPKGLFPLYHPDVNMFYPDNDNQASYKDDVPLWLRRCVCVCTLRNVYTCVCACVYMFMWERCWGTILGVLLQCPSSSGYLDFRDSVFHWPSTHPVG